MKSNYKRLGDFIKSVNNRNIGLISTDLRGLSMSKEFRKSTSNIVGTDLSSYKLVYKDQFACDFMSVIRVHKLPVVLHVEDSPVIVSPAYVVFEVIDKNKLDPEYLMMWFRRPEFDRYADFRCDSAIRGGFKWDELCDVELPIPSIEKQREIVREYNTIVNRIALNEQLIQKLEETAQAIYRRWFVEFEFPNGDGLPYKSSGGKMVWCEELDKEIPEGWENGVIGDLFTFQRGHDLPTQNRIPGKIPIFASTGIAEFHHDYKIHGPTIITGRSGSLGELFYYDQPCWPLNTTLYVKEFNKATPLYSLYFLQTIDMKQYGAGSAVPTLNRNDIHALKTEIPINELMKVFDEIAKSINNANTIIKDQDHKLNHLKDLLLSKMTKVEETPKRK